MRSSKVIAPLCLAIVCGACASLQTPPSEAPLREVACPGPQPEGDFTCGVLDVPENPDARRSRTIPIRVVVLRAKARGASDPLFVIAGGPGQATTEGAFFRTFFAPVREQRDIVLIDQRGTGGSNPLNLDPPPDQLFVRPETNMPPEWGRAALARLRGQADLTQYTTARAVADLDAVRRALGYERINLYGTSYGTRVVQYYVKRYGARVRTAVLKGIVTPSDNMALSYGRFPQRAFERLVQLCNADAGCASAHPDLRGDLNAALARLERAPARVSATDSGGQPVEMVVTRGQFAFALRSQMMSASAFPRLPALIGQAASGDLSEWAPVFMQVRRLYATQLHGAMSFSVIAAEDVPRLTEEAIRADAQGAFIGDALSRSFAELGAFWPRGQAHADLFAPLETDVPILLVSGDLDPATPPEGAEGMMGGLPNGLHIVFAGGAHSAANFTGLDRIIAGFINAGSVRGLDVSAARTNRPLPFQ